jgi:hypothetical protein
MNAGPAMAGGAAPSAPAPALAPAPAASRSSGSQYVDTLNREFSDAGTEYQRESRIGAALAGTPYGAQHEQAAAAAKARMNKLNDEFNTFQAGRENDKPTLVKWPDGSMHAMDPRTEKDLGVAVPAPEQDKPLTAQEKKDNNLPADAPYVFDSQTGNIKLIPIPSDDKRTNEQKNWEFYRQQQQEAGKPVLPFDQYTKKGQAAPDALSDKHGVPIDENVPNESIPGMVSQEVRNRGQAFLEYREKVPQNWTSIKDPVTNQAVKYAERMGGDNFNTQSYGQIQKLMNDVSGGGKIYQSNISLNQALHHMDRVATGIQNLNNTNIQAENVALNSGSKWVPGSVDRYDRVTQLRSDIDAVANELGKLFHGPGAQTVIDVKRQLDNLDLNAPPQVQLGALREAANLLRGRLQASEEETKDGLGENGIAIWEKRNNRPFGFVHPESQAAADRIESMYGSIKAGKGYGNVPGSAVPETAASAAGQPKVLNFNPATGKLE